MDQTVRRAHPSRRVDDLLRARRRRRDATARSASAAWTRRRQRRAAENPAAGIPVVVARRVAPQIQILFPEGDAGVDATRLREFSRRCGRTRPTPSDVRSPQRQERREVSRRGESSTTRRRKGGARSDSRWWSTSLARGRERGGERRGGNGERCGDAVGTRGAVSVLTLWQDNALARGLKSGKPRRAEQDGLRVRMEKRTRILLGRSVKRKEARAKVREAYERAKRAPQGSGHVALEEALAEARDVGARRG